MYQNLPYESGKTYLIKYQKHEVEAQLTIFCCESYLKDSYYNVRGHFKVGEVTIPVAEKMHNVPEMEGEFGDLKLCVFVSEQYINVQSPSHLDFTVEDVTSKLYKPEDVRAKAKPVLADTPTPKPFKKSKGKGKSKNQANHPNL